MEDFQDEASPPRGGTWAGALLPSGGAIPPGELPSRRGKSSSSSSPTTLPSWGGLSSSTSSQHQPLPNPSSSLVFNLYIKTIDWCLWVTSSVDYILSLITIWFIWWKIICSDLLCYLIPLWSWACLSFVSSHFRSWGHGRNHVNLICVRYFDDIYVAILLVVSCERRLHDTSPYLGLRECIVE